MPTRLRNAAWRVDVHMPGIPVFHLIAEPERLLKRWERAARRKRLMPIRYAGRDYLLNPSQIQLMHFYHGVRFSKD